MAQKITLFELDIDINQAVKAQKAQAEAVEDLKKAVEELTEAQGENAEATIEKNAELKVAQKQLRENKKTTEELIQVEKSNEGSIEQLRRKLSLVTVEWKKLSKEERKNTDRGKALTKQKLKLTESLKKEEKATGDTRRNVGNYSADIQDAAQKMGLFSGAVGPAVSGMKQLGFGLTALTGPFGLIIAAIGLVISALTSFFTSSEEGQDALARLGAIFTTVIGNIVDLLSGLGKALLEPKKAFDDFRDTMENTFGKVIDGIFTSFVANIAKKFAQAGLLFQKFKDLFTDNAEGIADAQENLLKQQERVDKANAKTREGLENTKKLYNQAKDAVIGLVKETEKEIAIAQNLADRQANLNRLRRETNIQLAKNKSEVQDLLLITRDQTKSFDEQREALIKANKIREEERELKDRIALENLNLIKSQNALSNSTIEDLDKEAQAEVELFNLRAENAAQRRELANRLIELDNRARAARVKADKEEQDRLRQESLDAIELLETNLDNRLEIYENDAFKRLEIERERLELQRQQEIEAAELIGADVQLINEKFAKADIELTKAKENVKIGLAADFAGQIAQLAGEQTAIGKIAAVAQATANTYLGATAAFAQTPGGIIIKTAAATLAVAQGLNSVRKILSVKSGLPGDTGGTVSGSSTSSTTGSSTSNINPEIGQGIVTRDSQNQTIQNNVTVQPIVVDAVTAKQNQAKSNNVTGDI
jgi:hypothetical protein